MNLTPKQDFIKTGDVRWIASTLADPKLRQAIQSALLQFQIDQTSSIRVGDNKDAPQSAEAAAWRIAGAVGFANTLLNIAELPEPKGKDFRQNLSS